MAKFVYFTPEEKARAQNTDLVSLLRAQGGGSTVPSVRVAMPSALSNAKYGCGFRNKPDDGRHRLHGSLTPLRLSQIVLIALRRFTARQDRFTLGLWLGECIIILTYRSSPQARHGLLCVKGPLPLFLLSRRDHGLSLSHGFSLSGCTSNVSG